MPNTWTTAYLAALAGPDEILPVAPPKAFGAQTVRQAVRLRRGGTALRLVLSNEFGRTPLVLDEVTVGDSASRTVLPALRGGSVRWEILAGHTAVSDPIPLSIAAGEDLLISAFVATSPAFATFLPAAARTAEFAPGNQLGRSRLADAERFTSLYWIAQVLVDVPATGPVVVAVGDSITRGDGTTTDLDQRYPDHLQRGLVSAGVDGAVVLNAGLSGNRLLGPRVGPSMTDRFARDVLAIAETTHVVIAAGINDLALAAKLGSRTPTAEELTDGLFTLADRARRHGIQPILGTITPFAGSTYESFRAPGNDEIRQTVNKAVAAQRDWPVADFATAVADPNDATRLAPAHDSGDGVHPSDAGAKAIAASIDPALFDRIPT